MILWNVSGLRAHPLKTFSPITPHMSFWVSYRLEKLHIGLVTPAPKAQLATCFLPKDSPFGAKKILKIRDFIKYSRGDVAYLTGAGIIATLRGMTRTPTRLLELE
jgi:hypothetical protein